MCGGLCAPVIRATWSDGPTHQGLPVSRWILKPKVSVCHVGVMWVSCGCVIMLMEADQFLISGNDK